MNFYEKYQDVLQNIEFGIVTVYKRNPSLMDVDPLDALEALIRHYSAEEAHRRPPALQLGERGKDVFNSVQTMCEWRLGRESIFNQEVEGPFELPPLSVGELIECLKVVHRSVRRWNKEGGRQGYLKFVSEYVG